MHHTPRRFAPRAIPRLRFVPTWSNAFGLALVLLIINLLWNAPLARLTGGGAAAFFLVNIVPSVAAVLGLLFERSGGNAQYARMPGK